MSRHRRWVGYLVLAGCLFPDASAGELFGVDFELPFEHTVRKVEHRRSGPGDIAVTHKVLVDMIAEAGEAPGELMLMVVYAAPQGSSDTAMQEAFDKASSETASRPGTRDTGVFNIDDFQFQFVDGPLDKGEYPERMTIGGVVNGALLHLTVSAKDATLLTPALAERLKATRIDYAELLRAKAEFEAESRLAVQETMLDTPLARAEIGRGVRARLSSSYLQTDGAGRPLFRAREFTLFKVGFWAMQGLSFSVGCGERAAFEGTSGVEEFLAMAVELRVEDEDHRPVGLTPTEPSELASLPARMVKAKGVKITPLQRTSITRWQAENEGNVYQMEIERFNGYPIEKDLIRQLQQAEPMCQLGLAFAADGAK